jgi:hypothetical protein
MGKRRDALEHLLGFESDARVQCYGGWRARRQRFG